MVNSSEKETRVKGLGSRLAWARYDLGLGLREAARIARVDPGYLSQVENDRKQPSDMFLAAITLRLGIAERWLTHHEPPVYDPRFARAREADSDGERMASGTAQTSDWLTRYLQASSDLEELWELSSVETRYDLAGLIWGATPADAEFPVIDGNLLRVFKHGNDKNRSVVETGLAIYRRLLVDRPAPSQQGREDGSSVKDGTADSHGGPSKKHESSETPREK